MKRRPIVILIVLAAAAAATWYFTSRASRQLVLTGIVTTDTVLVGSEIQGRVLDIKVKEGDVVKRGDLLATIQPQEWQADLAYYTNRELQSVAMVTQAKAELKYQDLQTSNQILQAEANLQSAEAQVAQASAELENAKILLERLSGGKAIETLASWSYANDAALAEEDFSARGEYEIETPYVNPLRGVGRNDPCPCGSGKKYKHCCGKN